MEFILLKKTVKRSNKNNKMDKKGLLEIRKKQKSKKPNFIRQDAHKKVEIKSRWREARGLQSKMRLGFKGYRKTPSQGYRSPVKVRNLHPSGLKTILINNISQLSGIDKEAEGVIVASTVGVKKKIDLLNKAKELGITILNIKDTEKFIKQAQEKLAKRKEKRDKTKQEKEKKKPKKDEKKNEKEAKEELTDKEKQEKEKKEKDKLLTKKGQ